MKLLTFDDFYVVFIWHDAEWRVAGVFRHIHGCTEAEPASVSNLPWRARQVIAEIIGDPNP